MGYMRHHAIIVTSWDDDLLDKAYAEAKRLFTCVSEMTPEAINGYRSFFVPPDGSKEGWNESDKGDEARAAFVEWLNRQRHSDRSSNLAWAEIQYGDEMANTCIVNDSDAYIRGKYDDHDE